MRIYRRQRQKCQNSKVKLWSTTWCKRRALDTNHFQVAQWQTVANKNRFALNTVSLAYLPIHLSHQQYRDPVVYVTNTCSANKTPKKKQATYTKINDMSKSKRKHWWDGRITSYIAWIHKDSHPCSLQIHQTTRKMLKTNSYRYLTRIKINL